MIEGVRESEQPVIVPSLFEDQPTVLATINQNNKPTDEEGKTRLEEDETNDKENQLKSNENKEVTKRVTKRKKKLIIDEVKEIDSVSMKAQLNDTSSILSTLELAPPTKKLMQLKESGSIDKLLMNTSRTLNCLALQRLYTRNMITRKIIEKPPTTTESTKEDENQIKNFIAEERDITMEDNERQVKDSSKLPLADLSAVTVVEKTNDTMINNNINDPGQSQIENFEQQQNTTLTEENELGIIPAPPLEATPPQQTKHKSTRDATNSGGHRKSGVTNVTSLNTDLIIDDENDVDSNKILNKRAKTMISLLNKSLTKNANIGFFELTKRNGRKQVAQKFYSLLILKKYDAIDVTQCESFGDIIITKSNKFDNFVSS